MSMARATISDCLERFHNPFDLVTVASKRARQLNRGAKALLPRDKHSATIQALREIAAGLVLADILDEPDLPAPPPSLVEHLQWLDLIEPYDEL
jgi:DNA-directed RNA polymerase subunit omega